MKKRIFAAILAAVMLLLLLPAAALAASLEDFCTDPDCLITSCTGPGNMHHKDPTRLPDFSSYEKLNLSSLGVNQATRIPGKPGMTLNGIPYIPDVGENGTILIGTKDLLAVLNAELLLSLDPSLTKDDLLIQNDRLYVKGVSITDPSFVPPEGFTRITDTSDLIKNNFELALNGKKLSTLHCDNVWPDKETPYFDPAYAGIGLTSSDTTETGPVCNCDGGNHVPDDPDCPVNH